ncbi:MAG: NAD(+)/NADH kinase [Candidatus Bathyarchaeota archaeon]|nr:NAD(+)/NADH kinase [Candidatus Bathyarchaeota archaeon]
MVKKVFKSVGLVARYDKKQAFQLAKELAEYIGNRDLEVYIEDTITEKIDVPAKTVPLKNMKTDFIITIGGDGTILRTCLKIPKPEPPILAINMGVRGFLAEVEPKETFNAVEKTLKGDFKIEKCAKLAVCADGKTMPDALNEVVISAGEPSKILYTQIYKNKEPILKCQADGLIVSTQTGSTGYSLSAGGPVLDPKVEAFVLTPICSLTVFRSIIFSADSNVTIEAIRPKKVLVLIDGNYRQVITSKKPTLTITRSKNVASFIRFKDDFYHRLRSRLLFKGM